MRICLCKLRCLDDFLWCSNTSCFFPFFSLPFFLWYATTHYTSPCFSIMCLKFRFFFHSTHANVSNEWFCVWVCSFRRWNANDAPPPIHLMYPGFASKKKWLHSTKPKYSKYKLHKSNIWHLFCRSVVNKNCLVCNQHKRSFIFTPSITIIHSVSILPWQWHKVSFALIFIRKCIKG